MSDTVRPQSTGELARLLRAELRGSGDVLIHGFNLIPEAGPTDLTFVGEAKYIKAWKNSRAAAAVVSAKLLPQFDPADSRPLIAVEDADRGMIDLLRAVAPPEPQPDPGVHPSAVVHPDAVLGARVRIGPHVTLDRGVKLGDDVVLHAGVRIYADVEIGDGCVLHANTVVRHRCRLGRRVLLHQNVSIGADGFGYRPPRGGEGWIKIPHIGNVVLEDDVEIGAGTCIDRAKFGTTWIGEGTKIDNLCQIGHNVRIGRHCSISGLTGVAGSTVIEEGVLIGGGCNIRDHITIGARARVGGASGVSADVPAGATVMGYPADDVQACLRQWASVRKLPEVLRQWSAGGTGRIDGNEDPRA
jgi:UDP-3-O-[3-hydroxymyristoyl] glucosamine N-acyltransferase